MKRAFVTCALTLTLLVVLDGLVAFVIARAEASGKLASIVQYFEYGRSVPGKHARWVADPDIPGNSYGWAWRSNAIGESTAEFAQLQDTAPAIRSYGMSFVENILTVAVDQLGIHWESIAGPGAPPNYTFAVFEEDRANRRAGDVVVFGILSSSVPGMAALSNRSWFFEQPAPFTYPIYLPAPGDGQGLERIEPLINNDKDELALANDPEKAAAWTNQMAEHDAFYGFSNFGAPWLDHSPFVRLVRRTLAISDIEQTKADFVANKLYPYEEVLQRMIVQFAALAREDGQIPVVMLLQSRDPGDADLLALAKPVLDRDNIPYLAPAEHIDLKNPANFQPDGHYALTVDKMLAERFIDLIGPLQ